MAEPDPETPGTSRHRLRLFGRELPPTIELLRLGAGIVWVANLVFILDPSNDYWSHFSTNALSFAPTTIGGPGLAQYVSAHPLFFSWAVALVTGYLGVALVLGLTTRTACLVGTSFSGVLLAIQFGSTFFFPGGTDVGEHPLYILIYLALALGGAGRAFSLDARIDAWRIRRRIVRPAPAARVPGPWATAVSPRTLFAWAVAGTLLSFGVGMGLVVLMPVQSNEGTAPPIGPVHFVNLTIVLNATNGWPQYVPANFSVPEGRVNFTITDLDTGDNWTGCQCQVRGTVGGYELVNGTRLSTVPTSNVAHTFTVPALGLEVISPGTSVVQFTADLLAAGNYTWFCLAPCGQGGNPFGTPPMGTPGFMTGTMTVS